ncbi:MAG: P-loop NTPase fold protein [Halobacteriota archaeon]|nr:P-loop NTPase fold protein [Halobacteriota archaeon]
MKRDISSEIRFLPDQPLEADKINQEKFGHDGIAESLKNIILNCPNKFTIGLFGKWGVGKTTIINLLKDNKLSNEEIAIVEFDVWKHEGDALRRTFLKDIVKQLKETEQLSKNYELTDRLDKQIVREFENEIGLDDILKLAYPFGLIILSLIVGIGLVMHFFWPQYLGSYVSYIFGGTLTAAILVWILEQALTTETTTESFDRFQDPHEFESEFKKIVQKIPKEKKLLVIIDNLDRTRHEKAVELLSTIKTFLEQDRCIFLIACDDEAIKKHLESVYLKNSEKEETSEDKEKLKDGKNELCFDSDEFLRKFFNAFICIPEFIDSELLSYTEGLLEETNVEKLNDSNVVHVITAAFRDNPRQIKQFINVLISQYLLGKEREEGQNLLIKEKGTITNNLDFLAKLMVIRQKCPNAYKKIEQEKLNSTEINGLGEDFPKLKDFLDSTTIIPEIEIKNIRPFIYLKQSETEIRIPDESDLSDALSFSKQDVVNKIFGYVSEYPNLLKDYEVFIISLLKDNKSRTNTLFNIVSSSLNALKENSLDFSSKEYYNKVAELLGRNLPDKLHRLSPSLVFDQVIGRCDNQFVPNIVSKYVEILSGQSSEDKTPITYEWTIEIFQVIVNCADLFKEKGEISKALAETYYSNIEILSLFTDENVQKDFISKNVLSKFISTFSEGDIDNKEDLNNKIQLLLDFKSVMTSNEIQGVVNKFNKLLAIEIKQGFREEKENFLSGIERILDNYHEFVAEIEDKNELATFADNINQGTNAIRDWNQKKIFVFTCLLLKKLLSDPQKANINDLITNFWNNTTPEGIEYVLNKLTDGKKQEVFSEYWDTFQNRSANDKDIFDNIWPSLQKEKQKNLFQRVINSNNYQWGLDKLKELDYKIDFGKKEAVSILLDRVEGVLLPERNVFYKAINAMKCGTDVKLRNKYATQLKTLLTGADENSQKVGYNGLKEAKYLSETHKRDITRKVIEWLRQLSPIDYTYHHSIRSVVLNWDVLQSTPQRDYIDLVFDKFIKNSSDMDDIRLGLEIIYEIKPTYNDYKTYFDDILVRIEGDQNNDIKNKIKNGLLEIKPDSLSEYDKEFWTELEDVVDQGEE